MDGSNDNQVSKAKPNGSTGRKHHKHKHHRQRHGHSSATAATHISTESVNNSVVIDISSSLTVNDTPLSAPLPSSIVSAQLERMDAAVKEAATYCEDANAPFPPAQIAASQEVERDKTGTKKRPHAVLDISASSNDDNSQLPCAAAEDAESILTSVDILREADPAPKHNTDESDLEQYLVLEATLVQSVEAELIVEHEQNNDRTDTVYEATLIQDNVPPHWPKRHQRLIIVILVFVAVIVVMVKNIVPLILVQHSPSKETDDFTQNDVLLHDLDGSSDAESESSSTSSPSSLAQTISTSTQERQSIWKQLGNSVLGDAFEDWFGESLALSGDGRILVAGAILDDGNGEDAGEVKIYRIVERESGSSWMEIHSLLGESPGEWFGESVALASDGTVLAVGAPWKDEYSGHVKVYQSDNDGQNWNQLGTDILGEDYSGSGWRVALSANGNILAVGASGQYGNDSFPGYVKVYTYNETLSDFVSLGDPIRGGKAYDQVGASLALSGDGRVLVVGSMGNPDSNDASGFVKAFHFDESTSTYKQLGQTIIADGEYDGTGVAVAISGDGLILSVGAPSYESHAGQVRVYSRKDDPESNYGVAEWIQLGNHLRGKADGDEFGFWVALSSNGKILAAGAPWNNDYGQYSGQVQVFELSDNNLEWQQIGQDIIGEAAGDRSGGIVALSANGMTLAIGATGSDANADGSGHVRVFTLEQNS